MSTEIHAVSSASDLPPAWDQMSVHLCQHRSFLEHTEQFNPCHQCYYLLYEDGGFAAGASVYSLGLNLLAFRSGFMPIKSRIVGLPCSVSASGLVGHPYKFGELLLQIRRHERGLLLVLNLDAPLEVARMISGRTLPTVIFHNRFSSWAHYVRSLRSSYRRRVTQLSRPFEAVETVRRPCRCFSERMYDLYLDVLRRSEGKLETLSFSFLQQLPNTFQLSICHSGKDLLGWYISTSHKSQYCFFLGGIDYNRNREFNTYFNILFLVLQDAIEQQVTTIDFGQTAAIAKTRLGGKAVEKSLLCSHSNRVVQQILSVARRVLEYAKRTPTTHVFGDAP